MEPGAGLPKKVPAGWGATMTPALKQYLAEAGYAVGDLGVEKGDEWLDGITPMVGPAAMIMQNDSTARSPMQMHMEKMGKMDMNKVSDGGGTQ